MALPVVSARLLVEAAHADPSRPQGGTTPGAAASVRLVEQALLAEGLLGAGLAGDGAYGGATIRAYRRWQQSHGYGGSDADGVPDLLSLRALGIRHGFAVDSDEPAPAAPVFLGVAAPDCLLVKGRTDVEAAPGGQRIVVRAGQLFSLGLKINFTNLPTPASGRRPTRVMLWFTRPARDTAGAPVRPDNGTWQETKAVPHDDDPTVKVGHVVNVLKADGDGFAKAWVRHNGPASLVLSADLVQLRSAPAGG